MGKIIELSKRLRGQQAEPKLTLRERMDKERKTRSQVIELLEVAYSKYLALGEQFQELAKAYQNQQRLGITLTMHAAGTQLLTPEGKLASDEVTLVIDQRVGDALAGDLWDMSVEPTSTDGGEHLIVKLRRRVQEPKTAGSEG